LPKIELSPKKIKFTPKIRTFAKKSNVGQKIEYPPKIHLSPKNRTFAKKWNFGQKFFWACRKKLKMERPSSD